MLVCGRIVYLKYIQYILLTGVCVYVCLHSNPRLYIIELNFFITLINSLVESCVVSFCDL